MNLQDTTHRVLRSRLRRAVKTFCAALTCSAAVSMHVSADGHHLADLSIEELMDLRVESVYGASRYEQKVTQAPSSVSIITAEEIRRYGHRTLTDVLRSVRGLYVSDDRNYTYLGIRGFHQPGDYNMRMLVMVDGHRINDNIFDGGKLSRDGMVDVELIERVEVIRGPSSSIYGSSAFFGVINVITKRGGQFDGVELAGKTGSYDTHQGRLTYGSKLDNGIEWLVSGSHYTGDGPRRLYFPEFDQRISADPRASNDGFAENLDGEDAYSFFTNLRYGDFSLSGLYSDRTKQVPTAPLGTMFNDPRTQTADYRGYLDLKYDHSFSDALHLTARGFYDDYTYYGFYPYDDAESGHGPDPVLTKRGANGRWFGTEWQLTAKVSRRHTLIMGGEYRENLRQHQYWYHVVEPRMYHLDHDSSSHTLGLFAQDDVQIRENLVLSAGVRYDDYSESFGSVVNPRLGLIYSPSKTSTIKALYGEAFRAPNPFERYHPQHHHLHELEPEEISTYELVYEQYLGRRYRLNVSTYYTDVSNLISQVATVDGNLRYANWQNVDAAGVELEVEGKFESGAHVRASYGLQRSEDGPSGRELWNSPRHLGKLNLSVPLFHKRLFTSLELQYRGESSTLRGSEADEFVIANLSLLSPRTVRGWELSLGVYNLFDTRYVHPVADQNLQDVIEQDGRTVQGAVSYKF